MWEKVTSYTDRFVASSTQSEIDIRLEECIVGMDKLASQSVDVVVTSPPYNIGVDYSRYDDTLARNDYLAWLYRWADAVRRILKPKGSLFLNVGSKPSDPWVPFQAAAAVAGTSDINKLTDQNRFVLQNTLHWIKSIAIDAQNLGQSSGTGQGVCAGHYKPINSPRYVNDVHEYVFHFSKDGAVPIDRLALGVPYQDKSNIRRWKAAGKDKRCRGNNWFIPYQTIQRRAKERPHPATFPVQLAAWCLKLHGIGRTRLVVDPFLGLASSAIACAELGLSFVGFEIDPAYFAEAVKRVRQRLTEV